MVGDGGTQVMSEKELRPVAASREAPRCHMCKRGEWTVAAPALAFKREGGKLIPLCRMHGGNDAGVTIQEAMEEWVVQDILES